jgi:hypothetical protein
MKRLMALATVTVLAVCIIGGGAAAGSGRPRTYEGPLGEGRAKIQFDLLKREGRPLAIRSFGFGIVSLTCDGDGSVQEWGVEFGWFGRLPELPSHMVDLDVVDPDSAIHLHGKVQAVQGEGTLVLTIPALTADEQAQVCTTGELSWTVVRTVPPVLEPPPTPAPTPIQVLHFVAADGAHVTLTRVS